MNQNLVTWKIKYSCDDSLLEILHQYNSVFRFTYNRMIEGDFTTAEITERQREIQNCGLIGSHLKNSAIYDAKSLMKDQEDNLPAIFGGRNLFLKRCQHKISREEFLLRKLRPLNCVGEANQKGNRLFKIVDNKTIQFNFDRKHHYTLQLESVGKNRSRDFAKLIELQNSQQIAITYKLGLNFVYLTFDYSKLKFMQYDVLSNRVMAIDLNPQSIGWSVVDWHSVNNYKVIQSGTFELRPLFEKRESRCVASYTPFHKYYKKKRKHELVHIAKQLFTLCRHYRCEVFTMEDLNIKSKDNKKGKRFNKLTNNVWCRNLLAEQMRKHIKASSTELVECRPQYSSYIGNILYRENHLPDECLSSIEIGRRGFEFATQYIFKRRPQKKTVVYPELQPNKTKLALSLEEIGVKVSGLNSWKSILSEVKESGKKYRFSSSEAQNYHSEALFSKFYKRKYLQVNTYL